ncbi:unnamed protein product, partial [Rotaria magnacalcarata]
MVKGFREQLDSDDEQQQQQQPTITTNQSVEYEKPEYEPESPAADITTQPLSPPIYHQITSSDLDFLDQLSTSKPQQSYNEPHTPDSQSIHSDSASTKAKKKKTTTKPKK